MSAGAGAAVGLLAAVGACNTARICSQSYPRLYEWILGSALWLDFGVTIAMLSHFGNSEFGASAATTAAVLIAGAAVIARRRLARRKSTAQ
jgi:hypothetical protein